MISLTVRLNAEFGDAAGQYAGKQASRTVSMDIAFVITLPIKLVQRDSGRAADADPMTARLLVQEKAQTINRSSIAAANFVLAKLENLKMN